MALGRFLAAAAASVACLLAGENAIAVGRLLAPAGTEPPVQELRAAVALAPRQTTVWWSLELKGPERRVTLVVPAAPGAAVDPASSHWFEALEQATAPRIALSGGAPACGGLVASQVHDTSQSSTSGAIAVSELAVLSSLDEVAAFAKNRGLEFAPADRDALSPYAPVGSFIAFSYDIPERGGATETLRMTWHRPESKPLFELLGGGAKVVVTLWTIASGRAGLPPAREYRVMDLAPSWKAVQGRSDYPERRQAWLDSRQETTWLIEAAGDDLLYDWRVLPGSTWAIQPVVSSYLVEDPAGACAGRVAEAQSNGARVAPACAKGVLGIVEADVGHPRCVESPAAGEIDPEMLRCGAHDDLAFALADQDAGETWVTRHRGVLLSQPRQSIEIRAADSTRVSPVVSTSSLDVSGCGATGGSSGAGAAFGAGGASGVSGSGFGVGGWGGMPNRGGAGNTYPDPYDPHPHTVHESSSVDVGCSSSGGDADCGGDTSSGGGDDGCSGDSSESSSEDSEGCGCDSSDDESEGGDDCGGDSSSDGGDDCSGDSSSDGGDDCSGDSGGGGDDCSGDSGGGDCGGEAASIDGSPRAPHVNAAAISSPRPRRFRPRVSAVTLVLCAIALFLRRSGRREYEGVVLR